MIDEKDTYKARPFLRRHSPSIIAAGADGQEAVQVDNFTESLQPLWGSAEDVGSAT
jgi:hypothetical protein